MKCTDLWKHHQLQRCLTYSKGDRTACQAFGIGELRFGGKQLMVGCGYAGIELLALWGQGDTAIGTDEECTAKRVLQIFDRARNVWFVVHQNCSGAREALMLGDEVEDTVVIIRNIHNAPLKYLEICF